MRRCSTPTTDDDDEEDTDDDEEERCLTRWNSIAACWQMVMACQACCDAWHAWMPTTGDDAGEDGGVAPCWWHMMLLVVTLRSAGALLTGHVWHVSHAWSCVTRPTMHDKTPNTLRHPLCVRPPGRETSTRLLPAPALALTLFRHAHAAAT
mmetsp:Transcript_63418/g.131938  ORF Transcript_63418/g.131938 Transcript_63418/m.131938 type:complete len:151 (-) Transcript_63418:98-550(-)